MEFDEIFSYIGEFGVYQIFFYGLVGISSFLGGPQAIAMTFLGGYQEHWCDIDNLNRFPYEQQKYVGIPYDGETGEYSTCKYYDLPYDNLTDDEIWRWNWTDIDSNVTTLECEDWVFDQSVFVNTITSQFGLVCGKSFLVNLVSSFYLLGLLFGGFISGILGDRFGRKIVLIGGSISLFTFAFAAAYSPNYITFITLRFFMSVSNTIGYLASFVMIMEIIGPRYRAVAGVVSQVWFSIGFMVLPGIAYFVRDHKNLQIVIAVPILITLVYIFLVPESPRWLISNGQYIKATKILEKIADVNQTKLPEKLQFTSDTSETNEPVDKGSFKDLFTSPVLCREILAVYLAWSTNSLMYYGLSLNTSALVGDVFLNTFISGSVEIPANFICIVSMYVFGRKPTVIWAYLVAGISSFLCIPFLGNEDLGWLVTTLTMIGKASITITFSTMYVYTAELFPTPIRALAMGSSSTMSRIGALIAPFMGTPLMAVWTPLPSVIFGIMGLLSGLAMFLLPETLNKKLPDTIAEAEEIGRFMKKKDLKTSDVKRDILENTNEYHDISLHKTNSLSTHDNLGYHDLDVNYKVENTRL